MVRYKDFEEVSLVVDEMFTQIMQASGNITYYTIVHGTDSEVHQSSMVMVMQTIAVKIVMRIDRTPGRFLTKTRIKKKPATQRH